MDTRSRNVLLSLIPFGIGMLWMATWLFVPPVHDAVPMLATTLITFGSFALTAFLFVRSAMVGSH